MQLWICPLLAFLLGSIPFGLLIAKARGIDIRKQGSGNIGATNVLRVMGKKYGVACLVLDALKGFIPTLLAINLIRFSAEPTSMVITGLQAHAMVLPSDQQWLAQLVQVLTGLCAILGHNYSPWVGFKGGKGIATSAGVVIALMPAAIVILLLAWYLLFVTTRYVSVASIGSVAILPVVTHLGARFHHLHNDPTLPTLWQAGTWNKPLFAFSVVVALLGVWKHRSNIQRLRLGTEHRFERRQKT
ncbi:MAG: glycerol-3-phosphate 1-O-acyltransferase PlsY [Verrucomicrobia bacterium]|nr:MAG: glycerol-3-phosphate 1-O-acyltransferase PlsY [Verrucomicrobiota bacterium]